MMNRGDAATDATAFLGVFGKHPGWNDHIDDIGLATERLVQVKRILYVEGIGGNIDAGAWDSLPDTGRLPEFDHLFLWRAQGELVLGRFWSSTDGKGRKRYPMVVVAQVRGWPVSWQLRYVLPVLDRLETEFKAATTAERVIALAQNATRELEALASGDPAPSTRFEATATSVLAAHDSMGPERRGLYRLLYQMERDLSAYLRGGGRESTRSRTIDLTPRHLRVPRAGAKADADALQLWWRFMGEHVGESTPLALILPEGGDWVDILVGEPGVSQFTCVLANQHTIPLTTEIPYTFDDAFVARANERIAGAAPSPQADQPGKKPLPIAPPNVGKAIDRLKSAGGRLEQRQILMLVGAGVLGLVVLIALIALFSGALAPKSQVPSADQPDGPAPRPAPRQDPASTTPRPGPSTGGTSPSPVTATFTQQNRDDFAEWCDSVEWAAELRQRLSGQDLSPLSADAHLAQTLVPLLEKLLSPTFELDPRTATPGGPRQLSQLRDQPPASAQTPEGLAKTAAALSVCRGIRASIQPAAWPARSQLERAAVAARDAGWTQLADDLSRTASSATLAGPGALASLDAVIRSSRPVADLLAALSTFNLSAEALAGVGDPRLARIRELLPAVDPGPSATTADRAAAAAVRMRALSAMAVELKDTAESRWPRLETDYFLAAAALQPPSTGVTEAYYRQWIQEARRDAYTRLDPAADPRTTWDIPRRVQALDQQVQALARPGASADPAAVQALSSRLTSVRATLAGAADIPWNRTEQARVERLADEIDRALAAAEGEHEALTGRLAEQWERVTTRLRERSALPGIDSPALVRAWVRGRDALLARFTTPDRLNALNDRVEDLEDFLTRVNAAIPVPPMPAVLPRAIDADALERALSARRESTMASLLEGADWDDDRYDPALLDTLAVDRVSKLADFSINVAEATRALAQAEAMLAAAYTPDEPASNGVTITSLIASAQPALVGDEVAAVLRPIADQVSAINTLIASREPARRAEVAADARAPLPASLAAWRALPETGWPADAAQLAREAQIVAALSARISGIGDQARRDALANELRAQMPTRWAHAANLIQRGSDQAALRQALASRESFGVRDDDLAPVLRFSVLADAFARQAAQAQGSSDPAALKAHAADFLTRVDALGLPPGTLAPARDWLAQVRDLTAEQPTAPVIDPTTLGPATVGWRGEQIDDRRVRFTAPTGSVWLEFVLVEPGDHPAITAAAYLCTTELSVAALQTIASPHLADLQRLTANYPPEQGDGPKTWRLRTRGGQTSIGPVEAWFAPGDVAEGIQAFATTPQPARPGPKTPATHIGGRTATQIAGWIGCRLPTIGEWQAGLARYESGGSTGDWNIRDATWAAHRDHVRSVAGSRMGIRYPDWGGFRGRGSSATSGDAALAASTTDGTLYFDDVDRPRGRVLLHLVGNVHEFVVLGAGGASGGLGVAGRSALSPPEDDATFMDGVAVSVAEETVGWADVGMRPAFGLEGGSGELPLWRRVQRVGASAPLLMGGPAGGG